MNIVRWISGKFTKYETAYAFVHVVLLRRIPSKYLKAPGDRALNLPLGTLFFDMVTLTFQLDLDILPLDLKIQVCISVCSAVRARHTDRTIVSKLLHLSRQRCAV